MQIKRGRSAATLQAEALLCTLLDTHLGTHTPSLPAPGPGRAWAAQHNYSGTSWVAWSSTLPFPDSFAVSCAHGTHVQLRHTQGQHTFLGRGHSHLSRLLSTSRMQVAGTGPDDRRKGGPRPQVICSVKTKLALEPYYGYVWQAPKPSAQLFPW